VIITKFNDRLYRYICNNEVGYRKYLKDEPDMAEVIGEYKQQIKPTLDVDAYINNIDVSEDICDINKIFSDRPVKYAKEKPEKLKRDQNTRMDFTFKMLELRLKIVKII
jgi:hypothetical protein